MQCFMNLPELGLLGLFITLITFDKMYNVHLLFNATMRDRCNLMIPTKVVFHPKQGTNHGNLDMAAVGR